MNELELIRSQLVAERNRATEVALMCVADAGTAALPARTAASANDTRHDDVRQARTDYLVFVLTRFEERDQMFAEVARAGSPASTAARQALDETIARAGTSREALAKLEAALAGAGSWRDFGDCIQGPWRARRDAIDALQAATARISDWRAVSFVDADSILQERALYARVRP